MSKQVLDYDWRVTAHSAVASGLAEPQSFVLTVEQLEYLQVLIDDEMTRYDAILEGIHHHIFVKMCTLDPDGYDAAMDATPMDKICEQEGTPMSEYYANLYAITRLMVDLMSQRI